MIKLKIKTGDIVRVIAGDHKGAEGKVLRVDREKNKAIVEGVNMQNIRNQVQKALKVVL
jgi:large subunit ribosomal protein L24